MNLLARLMEKLRRGTATHEEIENLDRRLFLLGAAASAGALVARPAIVDFGRAPPATDLDWRARLDDIAEVLMQAASSGERWVLPGVGAYAFWRMADTRKLEGS